MDNRMRTETAKSLLLRDSEVCDHLRNLTVPKEMNPRVLMDLAKPLFMTFEKSPHSGQVPGSSTGWGRVAGKDLGVLVTVTEREPGCAQGAKKGNGILAWISNGVASRSRAGIVPLCWALVRPHLEGCVQFWALHYYRRVILVLEQVHRRAVEHKLGQEQKSSEEQLRELGILILEKRKLRRDLITLYSCLKGGCSQVTMQVSVPTKTHELLHRMSGKGLAAHYHFSRQPGVFGDRMVPVQVTLTNTTDQKIENIHIGEKKLPPGMRMHEFNPIECLGPGGSITATMGIDFCDSTQTASFQLCTKDDHFNVNIQPPVGELLLPVTMSEKDFKKEQGMLTGMNETSATIAVAPQNSTSLVIIERIVKAANLGVVPSGQDNTHRFAAKTVHSGSLVLVTVELKESSTAQLIINTEKTVIGSVLLRELKPVLSQG
ncbi:hypothetical protein DUI87_34001 [Hirundo rustica rustica]|uniref:AP-3 complex subunit beta C-terminal domain-containing protein n=1 Tax=Hirundo rustica rustica TaxID=333673 RepID=A0A3M0IJN0_HIRRU|nr:hypothetical protein DUI87_34001 [Hirundo rustica rustica]